MSPASPSSFSDPQRFAKVTVVGAGNVGATTAQLLLTKNSADVVLIDAAEGLAAGKALDLMHMRASEQFGPRVTGSSSYEAAQDSDIVVITAGVARKPGMTREELINVNAGIVASVLTHALAVAPQAVYILVTNPLDVMTNLAARLTKLPDERLMGMGGVLDSARFVHAISLATGAQPADINAMVIGAHGEAMVPLTSLATVSGQPLASVLERPKQQIAQIVEATVQGGAAVVELLKTSSAFYAPASAITRMVQAILNGEDALLPVCAHLRGQYGLDNLYMGVPARLGSGGISHIVELPLSQDEHQLLTAAAKTILTQVHQAAVAFKP
ncbi:MAG: malate dehydrogenase [Coriobacteriales bacterium]|jgi:malate dehydrogenase|nr:malate dehydrogenase [Coriobacteriales bacterium]